MASPTSIPAASAAVVKASAASSSASLAARWSHERVSFRPPSDPGKQLLLPSKGSKGYLKGLSVAKAQLNENDGTPAESKSKVSPSKEKDAESGNQHSPSVPLSEEAISEFMAQVASLVKLVDSKDIVELQLKQLDCELIIRKKEALPQPRASAPFVMMNQPPPPVATPSHYSPPPPVSSSPVPTPAPPSAPKPAKSSQPPLKSPMAGTFYRSPGPGQPPFVKAGDKVNKGQVLCIIEAMKLMNEIEADQSGTVAEILVDDGKSVGVDQPLFVIEP